MARRVENQVSLRLSPEVVGFVDNVRRARGGGWTRAQVIEAMALYCASNVDGFLGPVLRAKAALSVEVGALPGAQQELGVES